MPEILIINFAKGASRTGELENWKMRELENEKILSVYSTLPKFETLAKCIPLKVTYLSYRKETEKNGREEGGFLVKKGCKEGGVSL